MLKMFHKRRCFTRCFALCVCTCVCVCCTYSKLLYYRMFSPPPLSLPSPLFLSQEDTRTSTPSILNFALRWKPSSQAELKARRESAATPRRFLATNQITIRYGNNPGALPHPAHFPGQSTHSCTCQLLPSFNLALQKNKYKNKKRPNAADRGLYLASKHFPILIFPDLHAPGPSHVRPVMPTAPRRTLSSLTFPSMQLRIWTDPQFRLWLTFCGLLHSRVCIASCTHL